MKLEYRCSIKPKESETLKFELNAIDKRRRRYEVEECRRNEVKERMRQLFVRNEARKRQINFELEEQWLQLKKIKGQVEHKYKEKLFELQCRIWTAEFETMAEELQLLNQQERLLHGVTEVGTPVSPSCHALPCKTVKC